ncbi:hypothetical protein B4064_2985 [Caldibacillus thermoamylovorans]|nr:hypothetical protein B4065_3227 [Caldibacillus thermoamylovorans]KIO63767.1 hypothetical protein B4064_2985 [Caldibacillus thermoamylovorans]
MFFRMKERKPYPAGFRFYCFTAIALYGFIKHTKLSFKHD